MPRLRVRLRARPTDGRERRAAAVAAAMRSWCLRLVVSHSTSNSNPSRCTTTGMAPQRRTSGSSGTDDHMLTNKLTAGHNSPGRNGNTTDSACNTSCCTTCGRNVLLVAHAVNACTALSCMEVSRDSASIFCRSTASERSRPNDRVTPNTSMSTAVSAGMTPPRCSTLANSAWRR